MRRRLILGGAGALGAFGFMMGLGAWRSGDLRRITGDAGALDRIDLARMDWELTDDRGDRVSPRDWLGRASMVCFGFTWCPDVCPTTLMDISGWLEDLGPEAERIHVSLITVDPERDSPATLSEYLSNFDPRIRGLTGTPAEVAQAAGAFGARYERIPREDGDYTMDHTSGVHVFRPSGALSSIIDFHEDRKFAVPKITRAIE
ncbi:SCO family protein [Paracoccus sp. MKU1]|uniref:SCO family protein n=1 Tax=Paracoccus sp. MKU1 TaxID=1745182 RepID=UPI0007190D3E|nr:SCO family protein [Paracoccus sp. MKU1]KRW97162.1 electron transport protein SCO1/SenC [Paracoccus sp. MKU1]